MVVVVWWLSGGCVVVAWWLCGGCVVCLVELVLVDSPAILDLAK